MFLRYNLYGILWGLLILFLSLLPGKDLPTVSFWELLSFDKASHMFFYGIFVFLASIGYIKQYAYRRLRYYPVRYSILTGVVYGGIIEIMQGVLIKDRFADVMDFFANFIGCMAGGMIFIIIYKGITIK